MFKSELIIVIFLLVILCILLLNSNNFEYFSNKHYTFTINNESNKRLISNNINSLMKLLNDIIDKHKIITNHQTNIKNIITNKLNFETSQQQLVNQLNNFQNSLNININEKQELDNKLKTINSKIRNNTTTINNKKQFIKNLKSRINSLNNTKRRYINYRNNTYYYFSRIYFTKVIAIYDRIIVSYYTQIQDTKDQLKPLENNSRILNAEKLEISTSISNTKLQIVNLTQNITNSNTTIVKNKENMLKSKEKLANTEDNLNNEYIKTFQIFNTLNNELDSYNLKPISDIKIIEDFKTNFNLIDIQNLKTDLENILKTLQKTNKIDFGKLKTCKIKFNNITFDNGYKEHILLNDNLSDNSSLKNMYYQIPLNNLKAKTNAICKKKDNLDYDNSITQKNVNDMCDNSEYIKSCLLLYNNNKIIDGTDNYLIKNNKCYKRIPFTKQIPYTKIKLPCII